MKLSLFPTFVLFVATACFSGCSDEHSAGDGHGHDAGSTAEPAEHGAAKTTPGSYEDWCGEHAVPESKCTRCNPTLVAAFKATNDWCAEHGLPESQCLKCNPDLKIVRPPKPAGGE